MKSCKNPECPEVNPQPLDNFSKSARHKDGRLPDCKTCVKNYRAAVTAAKPKIPCTFNPCTNNKAYALTGLCAGHQRQLTKGYELQPLLPGKQVRQNFKGFEKLCNRCRQWLPVNSFGAVTGLSGGVDNMCRRCRACLRYNMTAKDYQLLFEQQEGCCKICKEPPVAKPLYVDHDHACCPGDTSCGKCVRGLICFGCNSGLGMFKDNLKTLQSALDYLKDYKYDYVLSHG
jgi:hypothetical protein